MGFVWVDNGFCLCWSLVLFGWSWVLFWVIMGFVLGDQGFYSGWSWFLLRVIMGFVLGDQGFYSGWSWVLFRVIMGFVQGDQGFSSGWSWVLCGHLRSIRCVRCLSEWFSASIRLVSNGRSRWAGFSHSDCALSAMRNRHDDVYPLCCPLCTRRTCCTVLVSVFWLVTMPRYQQRPPPDYMFVP